MLIPQFVQSLWIIIIFFLNVLGSKMYLQARQGSCLHILVMALKRHLTSDGVINGTRGCHDSHVSAHLYKDLFLNSQSWQSVGAQH